MGPMVVGVSFSGGKADLRLRVALADRIRDKCSATFGGAAAGRMISRKCLTYKRLLNGASETRTRDLLHAMQTRSQLRHGPGWLDYVPTTPAMQLPVVQRPSQDVAEQNRLVTPLIRPVHVEPCGPAELQIQPDAGTQWSV